jgi:hypothetical protein
MGRDKKSEEIRAGTYSLAQIKKEVAEDRAKAAAKAKEAQKKK